MTTIASTPTLTRPYHPRIEFLRAVYYVGGREIRNLLRTPAAFIPSFFIPLFFYFVQAGTLKRIAEQAGSVANYEAFALPVAILFSVSNEGAGFNMVTDIERGYFDKVMLSPANRLAVLIGNVAANFAGVLFRSLVVTGVALAFGMQFQTGLAGVLPMCLIASMWGLVFAGVAMAVAIKTANAQAVQGALVFLFPLLFLTPSFGPREQMVGWLKTAVGLNPLTHILEAMRAFSLYGWDTVIVTKGLVAVLIMAPLTFGLATWALRSRLR